MTATPSLIRTTTSESRRGLLHLAIVLAAVVALLTALVALNRPRDPAAKVVSGPAPELFDPGQESPAGRSRSPELPLVKIVATGGTIANSADGRLSVESVLEHIPQIKDHARIEVHDYIRVGSSSITLDNEIGLWQTITKILREERDVDGIVITHGSNTSEETAWLMNLTLKTSTPVVVVGAQRQQFTLSEDGSRNLLDAVRVAASPAARGMGALLVVNQLIHYSRDVTKELGSGRVDTWSSGEIGALGYADGDMVKFTRKPLLRHTTRSEFSLKDITQAGQLPKVEVVLSTLDADGTVIDALVAAGYKGIVVGGFPTGSPTPAQRQAMGRAQAAGVVVVMGNRGNGGRTSSGDDSIGADDLSLQKARLLLMLALTKTSDVNEIKRIFNEY
jgi:L-asparaginase